MHYIAIVGRPNVGKSTLFNKIVGGRPAIVDGTPGVTRDRHIAHANRGGVRFGVIDSGGFEPDTDEPIPAQMREQTMMAVEESDVIFFVVDGRAGVLPDDQEIARRLRKSSKPITVVVNKIDTDRDIDARYAFSELGFENVLPISAEHSIGVEALIESAIEGIEPEPEEDQEPDDSKPVRVAIVGKPNVGKSSLVNRILGEKRMMVSEIAGTTRDAIDSEISVNDRSYTLIDTAGVRKKARVTHKLEKFSVIMAMKAIDRADVALLLIDATEGITVQDAKIAGLIEDGGTACIIVVNKWDAVEKDSKTALEFEDDIKRQLKFLSFAPLLFISAKTGQRVETIFEKIGYVYEEYCKRVTTAALNEIMEQVTNRKQPPVVKGRRVKFYFATQTRICPPTFVFMTNRPSAVHFSYRRYLANQLRELAGFSKTPIHLIFSKPAGRRSSTDAKTSSG